MSTKVKKHLPLISLSKATKRRSTELSCRAKTLTANAICLLRPLNTPPRAGPNKFFGFSVVICLNYKELRKELSTVT